MPEVKTMNMLLIVTCAAVYVLWGQPGWLLDGPLALRMASYHIFHANIAHLAVNSIAMLTLFPARRRDNLRRLAEGYVIASLVYPLSAIPCIGMSNIIYAVIGLRAPALSDRWWRTPPVLTFLVVTLLMPLLPGVAGLTHIVSLAAGVAVSYTVRPWRD